MRNLVSVNSTNPVVVFVLYIYYSVVSVFKPKVQRSYYYITEERIHHILTTPLPETELERVVEIKTILNYLTGHPLYDEYVTKVGNVYYIPQARYGWDVAAEYKLLAKLAERLARLMELTYVDESNNLITSKRAELLEYNTARLEKLDLAVLSGDYKGNLNYSLDIGVNGRMAILEFGRSIDCVLGVKDVSSR